MLKQLTSKELLSRTQTLVAEERRITLALIEHLEEIQTRRLHAELGYESLWAFCTRHLGLSEGAAQRRISAMRLTRDLPEAKVALATGRLSLSNAAKVHAFRQAQKKQGMAPSPPRELIRQVENLSQRECEAKLFEISPQALPTECERVVSASQEREIRMVISPGLYEKLQRIKGLIAHSRPNASYVDLVEYLVGETLPRLEKMKGLRADKNSQDTIAAAVSGGAEGKGEGEAVQAQGTETQVCDVQVRDTLAIGRALPPGKRVYLPVALKRAVFAWAGGRCEYLIDGRRCRSRYGIEIDHRIPLAGGGGHGLSQLRCLCRQHNLQQFEAWQRRNLSLGR